MVATPPAPAGPPSPETLQQRRDLAYLVLAGLFLGTMGMLNILGLTRFLQQIGRAHV